MTTAPRATARSVRTAVVALSLVSVAVSFGPFARSGDRVRTSYELVEVAGRADLLAPPADRLAPVWYLVPALGGAVVLAVSTRRHRLAGIGAGILGALVATAGVLVQRSVLAIEPAGIVAVPLGVLTATAGITLVLASGHRGGAR